MLEGFEKKKLKEKLPLPKLKSTLILWLSPQTNFLQANQGTKVPVIKDLHFLCGLDTLK